VVRLQHIVEFGDLLEDGHSEEEVLDLILKSEDLDWKAIRLSGLAVWSLYMVLLP
jgi:hypothetical protein